METNSTTLQFVDHEFPLDPGVQLAWLIFLSVVSILGVIGNSLILRVYSTKTLTTCTHVLIMALALFDLTICILLSLDICSLVLHLMKSPIPWVLYLSRYVRRSILGACIAITVLIAVDRHDCVCRPHRRFLTLRRGKRAAWISLVFSFIASAPDLIRRVSPGPYYNIMLLSCQTINFTVSLLVITFCYWQVFTKIRKHVKVFAMTAASGAVTEWSTRFQPSMAKTKDVGVSVIDKSTKSVSDRSKDDCSNHDGSSYQNNSVANKPQQASETQVVSLTTESKEDTHCNVRGTKSILNSVDQLAVKDKNIPRIDEKGVPVKPGRNCATLQRKTTIMLFITSLVFLLSWLPYWIFIALTIIDLSGSRVNRKMIDTTEALNIVLFANNALNPLIYGIANRRFRKDCLNVFRKVKVTN